MASAQNFRSALNGFNREDVVHYIEYLNTKHTGAINQLKSENQTLTDELQALRSQPAVDPAVVDECAALRTQNEELLAEIAALKQAQNVTPLAEEELEAYRRAEKAERSARERAKQIYCQATGALADATTQVDEAAEHFKILSQRITMQLSDLQTTVDRSKNALLGAAATMYTICPTDHESV